jgi:hypothetical protein
METSQGMKELVAALQAAKRGEQSKTVVPSFAKLPVLSPRARLRTEYDEFMEDRNQKLRKLEESLTSVKVRQQCLSEIREMKFPTVVATTEVISGQTVSKADPTVKCLKIC